MGFRLFRKTPEVTISVEGLRTSRGVFAANISRVAEIPRAMAPMLMKIPSGAASALGNKLAGQKKFNTTPSAIVAAKIKGGRVITSGLSGRLSCIAFSPVRRPPVTLWVLVRCRLHRRDLEGVYLIMMIPDRRSKLRLIRHVGTVIDLRRDRTKALIWSK